MLIRFLDIIISFFTIVLLMPLFLIISIFIKIDTKGPIFFKQIRVGKNNEDFVLLKFRSMHTKPITNNPELTIGARDPRITRTGYYIRKYKLDELPQLMNVLKGEMSIVGPRPEVRKYVNLYTEEQKKVLSVKPGITDLASIYYINENELLESADEPEKLYIEEIMQKKIRLNMEFINNRNVCNYLATIIKTGKKIILK